MQIKQKVVTNYHKFTYSIRLSRYNQDKKRKQVAHKGPVNFSTSVEDKIHHAAFYTQGYGCVCVFYMQCYGWVCLERLTPAFKRSDGTVTCPPLLCLSLRGRLWVF